MDQLYFDHAATTPMHPEVIKEMTKTMQEIYGNPSSTHNVGRIAFEKLEDARLVIAHSLGVKCHEIIFNSGGTEGDNTAIIETARLRQSEGKHLITTAIEHPAVMESMKYLENQGFEVTYLPVDEYGQITVDSVAAALRPDTILVSIMFVNNETGTIFPISEIGELLKDHPAYFHTDAVQAYGLHPIRPHEMGIDLLSVSAHKINGPKGTGFLYKSDMIQLPPLLHGGEQEEKRRAGTENLPAIVGMSKAVSLFSEENQQFKKQQYQKFNEFIIQSLDEAGIVYRVNGNLTQKSPHVLNLSFKDVNNNLLLMKLDLQGIAVSTGSACTSGIVEPSHVLEAMYGKDSPYIHEAIRISFGLGNTEEEVAVLVEKLIHTLTN